MLLLVCKQENVHKVKKRNIRFCKWMSPLKNFSIDTHSEMKECHIFIAITNKVRSNKMIAIRRRTFIIKVLFFISIPPFFLKIGGRHSHQMFLLELYNKYIHKTREQVGNNLGYNISVCSKNIKSRSIGCTMQIFSNSLMSF